MPQSLGEIAEVFLKGLSVVLPPLAVDTCRSTPLHFQVTDDVKVGGAVVIVKGAAVTGEILPLGKKNILGRGGKPAFSLSTVVAVDGAKIKVKASPGHSSDKNEHLRHSKPFAPALSPRPFWRIPMEQG